jgi:hypothetical protein
MFPRAFTGVVALATFVACVRSGPLTAAQAAIYNCAPPHVDPSTWTTIKQGDYTFRIPAGFFSGPAELQNSDRAVFRSASWQITFLQGFKIYPTGRTGSLSQQCVTDVAGRPAQVYANPNTGAYAVRWPGVGLDGRDIAIAIEPLPGTANEPTTAYEVPWTMVFPTRR